VFPQLQVKSLDGDECRGAEYKNPANGLAANNPDGPAFNTARTLESLSIWRPLDIKR